MTSETTLVCTSTQQTDSTLVSHRWLLIGLAMVFGIRFAYVLHLPNEIAHWRDGMSYDNIARNVVSGVGYWDTTGEWPDRPPFAQPFAPTSLWLPGYPLFVAGIYSVFGESYRAVYIAQAVLGVIIACFIYLLGKETLGKRVGTAAVLLYAIDPFAIYLCGRYQTEQLFALLVIVSLYCFLRANDGATVRLEFTFLFGVLAGVAVLTRTVAGLMFCGLCLVALLGIVDGFRQMALQTRVIVILVASIAFTGTLAPWVIRNYKLTGQYVLTTKTWMNLSIANNQQGGAHFTAQGLAALPPTSIEQSEVERQAIYKAFATDWIGNHPKQFAWFYVSRTIVFWSPFPNEISGLLALVAFVFTGTIYLFATVSMFFRRQRWRRLLPMYVSFLTFTLGYSLAFVTTRFRIPLYPLIEILASGGMLYVYERYLSNHSSTSAKG